MSETNQTKGCTVCAVEGTRKGICGKPFNPQHRRDSCDNPDPTRPHLYCGHSKQCHHPRPSLADEGEKG